MPHCLNMLYDQINPAARPLVPLFFVSLPLSFSAAALPLISFFLSLPFILPFSVFYHMFPTLQCVVVDDSMLQAILCLLACLRNLFHLLKVLSLGLLIYSPQHLCPFILSFPACVLQLSSNLLYILQRNTSAHPLNPLPLFSIN